MLNNGLLFILNQITINSKSSAYLHNSATIPQRIIFWVSARLIYYFRPKLMSHESWYCSSVLNLEYIFNIKRGATKLRRMGSYVKISPQEGFQQTSLLPVRVLVCSLPGCHNWSLFVICSFFTLNESHSATWGVELIGFHVSRVQFQVLHPAHQDWGERSSRVSTFNLWGGCNPEMGSVGWPPNSSFTCNYPPDIGHDHLWLTREWPNVDPPHRALFPHHRCWFVGCLFVTVLGYLALATLRHWTCPFPTQRRRHWGLGLSHNAEKGPITQGHANRARFSARKNLERYCLHSSLWYDTYS